MHPLEKHTLSQLRELNLLKPSDLVIVAVSAGSDSVALLHLFAAVVDELEIRLCAVYVDHGLRPDETTGEAALVQKLASQLQIDYRTGSVPVQQYGKDHGLSLEAAARQLRYEFLEKIAEELGAAAIAVAHTANDQAEELLLRLIRGSGRTGLSGMETVNYRGVIRPLLQITKKQLLDYLNERGISFLEDSSNAKRDFLRNRVRLDLLPYLEKNFNPAIHQTLLRTADILGSEDELLNTLAGDLYHQAVSSEEASETLRADVKIILAGHPALQRRVIERILVEVDAQPSFQQINKLLNLATSASNGKELHLPEGLRVIKNASALEFSYPAGRTRHRASMLTSRVLAFAKIITGPGHWPIEELGITLQIEVVEQMPDRDELLSKNADYLAMTKLVFPLKVRSAKPGDRFQPLGGPGSRKVADFFNDCKVAREKRHQIPILKNDKNIIALLGLRIDHRYRLIDSTEKALKITILSR